MSEPASQSPAPLRHAATVMLLRQVQPDVEVLVIRRHENLAFMGGMWVFPGGALAEADMSAAALACIPQSSRDRVPALRDLTGEPLGEKLRLGIAVAAYREAFEETGILLATNRSGRHCGDDQLQRLAAQRRNLAKQPALFAPLLAECNLSLDVERLLYWAHWITPSSAPRRFDTRFFAMAAPPEQTAAIDAIEAVEHAWMTPAALLQAAQQRRMPLAQPTLYNLMELEEALHRHRSLDALLAGERDRNVPPILPKMYGKAPMLLLMPWDSAYEHAPGEGVPPGTQYPERLRRLPSRLNR